MDLCRAARDDLPVACVLSRGGTKVHFLAKYPDGRAQEKPMSFRVDGSQTWLYITITWPPFQERLNHLVWGEVHPSAFIMHTETLTF